MSRNWNKIWRYVHLSVGLVLVVYHARIAWYHNGFIDSVWSASTDKFVSTTLLPLMKINPCKFLTKLISIGLYLCLKKILKKTLKKRKFLNFFNFKINERVDGNSKTDYVNCIN